MIVHADYEAMLQKMLIYRDSITGLAIAASLPKHYDITIIARNLPGDPDSSEWSSPWAGAIWLGLADSTEEEQKMQLDALAYWWQLALQHPESSARRIQMIDIMDHTPLTDVWYKDRVPGFRVMKKEELPVDAHFGVTYGSIIVTPVRFLPWIRQRLEANGVKFLRADIKSLSELQGMGHDVLINATGAGPKYLTDLKDDKVQEVRGQTVLVRSDYDKCWVRRGDDYTYCLSRRDGTCVLGGIKLYDDTTTGVDPAIRNDVGTPAAGSCIGSLNELQLTHICHRYFVECTRTCPRSSLRKILRISRLSEILWASVHQEKVECAWRKKYSKGRKWFMRMV